MAQVVSKKKQYVMAGKRQKSNTIKAPKDALQKTTVTLIRTGGIAGLRMTASAQYTLDKSSIQDLYSETGSKQDKLRDGYNHLFEIGTKKIAVDPMQLTEDWKKIFGELERKLKFVKNK